jgi:hypothetical protein
LLSTMGISGLRTARLEAVMTNNLKRQISEFNQAETELNLAEHAFRDLLVRCLQNIPDCQEQLFLMLYPGINKTEDSEPLSPTGQFDIFRDAHVKVTTNHLGSRVFNDEISKKLHFFQITLDTTGTYGVSGRQIEIIYQQCSGIMPGPCPDPDYYSGRVAWKEFND